MSIDNFLTFLYFKKFEIENEHKRLMNIHDFPSDAEAHRHDQKIADIQERQKDINNIISKYMEGLTQ
jgi:hypothetical protein